MTDHAQIRTWTLEEEATARNRRHLAAFLGECGQPSCFVCHRPTIVRLAYDRLLPGRELAR